MKARRFLLICFVGCVAKVTFTPKPLNAGVELNRARRGSGEDLVAF